MLLVRKNSWRTSFLFMGALTATGWLACLVGELWSDWTASRCECMKWNRTRLEKIMFGKQIHMLLQKRTFPFCHFRILILHTWFDPPDLRNSCSSCATVRLTNSRCPQWEVDHPACSARGPIGWNPTGSRLSCSCSAGQDSTTHHSLNRDRAFKCLCVWEHVFRITPCQRWVGECRCAVSYELVVP